MYKVHEAISKRIQIIMLELNLNQKKLSQVLKITQPAISKYLQGRVPPPFILLHLSQLSGKSIEWILTGKTESSLKNKVAEETGQYKSKGTLEEKIQKLPAPIKHKIESLIDTIIASI